MKKIMKERNKNHKKKNKEDELEEDESALVAGAVMGEFDVVDLF